ncbi:potassium channel subfamily K member 16-like [Acanthaster planci]|uniref:Potassium channel subfamily K member 16-like n=1 Tax=Acanthaster planci TaxID=133434 RepID=A0A8B7ZDR5_ACAPL|nr:potassium channel subfamily K member 16-like [Acanthaster planci]
MKPWKKCLLLLAAFLAYLFAGAFVIILIERDEVTRAQEKFFGELGAFVQSHYACGATPDEVIALMEKAGVAYSRGAFYSEMASSHNELLAVWSWPNSILFASSVVTTIGYGRLAPKTVGGQVFCLFFAVLGVPLCYVVFSMVGDTFNALWKRFTRCSDKCLEVIRSKNARRFLLGAITLMGLWILLVLLPSVIFTHTEPWEWWRAQYFCFVSLSTIGFGDVIYGLEREGDSYALDWSYKLGILVYFFLGLSLISIVFKGVWHSQRKNLNRAKARIRSTTRGLRSRTFNLGPHSDRHTFLSSAHRHDVLDPVGVMDALGKESWKQGVVGVSYRIIEKNDAGGSSSGYSDTVLETTV